VVIACERFSFWKSLLNNRWKTKDGRIEFDLKMLQKQVFYFQFPAILNSLVLSSWKLQVSLTIVNCSSENLVAHQDSISQSMIFFITLAILLCFFFFYNTFYKPDIDLRSLTFQYLEVKQTLRLRWHFQNLRVL